MLIVLLIAPTSTLLADIAKSPPMGWNSWNWWGKQNINENVVKQTIDAMIEKGIAEAGYNYVIVDGGWRESYLGPKGELLVHKKRFPSGIKALADYAHSKGMKFGLHTVPGSHDCGGDRVGSWGVEKVHVQQMVDWGVDFVKLDKCYFWFGNSPKVPKRMDLRNQGWLIGDNVKTAYKRWHDLIDQSGHSIVLSASAYEFFDFYPELTQMGRTTLDITAKSNGGAYFDKKPKYHVNVMDIAEQNSRYAKYAGNGYWNDPDMLITGGQGLTFEQEKVHFALWSIMTSPLFIGSDPISMGPKELALITNKLAIEINQDPNEQGTRIRHVGKKEIWAKRLSNGNVALLLLNRSDKESMDIGFSLEEIGLTPNQPFVDVFNNEHQGVVRNSFSQKVDPSSGVFLLIGKR